MKIVCTQDELSRFLQIVSRAIASKTTLPILTGILMETNENSLRCLATDLEIAIEVTVPNIQVLEPGSIVLPGKTFVDIIKHLPPYPIEIEFNDRSKMVSINSHHSSYQLPVLPLEEFPTLPELKDGEKVVINNGILKDGIRQTIYATLIEDPRPCLSSILWEINHDKLRLVATDVNRLAIRDMKIQSETEKTALVPVRSLREASNIFGTGDQDDLTVYLTDKLIFIEGLGIRFSSRLVEAQFPRYEPVIPKEFKGSFTVKRNEMIEALERTVLVSTSLKININQTNLIITAQEPDKGHSKEEVEIDLSGEPMEIGFNGRFLLDFLKTVESERIGFKYVEEQKPALLQGENETEYEYIVMPLKLA